MRFDETDENRAEGIAKRAIRHLVHYSADPAVALAHRVVEQKEPLVFPAHAVYQRMAAAEGLFILEAAQRVANGYDHVLFLSKVADLTPEALLACRKTGAPNRHAAGEGPWATVSVTKR